MVISLEVDGRVGRRVDWEVDGGRRGRRSKKEAKWWAGGWLFFSRSPSFPHKLALVIWGLASSRTLLNHLKKPLRHACTTQTSFRVNRASTPVTLRFFVATRRKLPLRVTSV